MIVHFGGYSSQMGGLNLEQNPCIFTCYREFGGLTRILRMIGTWAAAARRWGALIIRILRMMVHLGVFMLQLGGL